jgi:hypothetical protein
MMNLTSAFLNFLNAPRNGIKYNLRQKKRNWEREVKQKQIPNLHMKMATINLKTTAPALDINKLDFVFPEHSRAQRSTPISVAGPPLYQLAVRRSTAEMTC